MVKSVFTTSEKNKMTNNIHKNVSDSLALFIPLKSFIKRKSLVIPVFALLCSLFIKRGIL